MTSEPVKRKYDATSRRASAEATRDRVCATAEELFLTDGYAKTSIRAVAKAAAVSEATVYVVFADKATLLNAVILRAVRDNAAESLDAIATAPPHEILARFATSNAALMARAGRLIALGESASQMDAELRPLRDQAMHRLKGALRVIADALDAADLLRPTPASAADTLYAIVSESTYLRMTGDAGRSPDDYASWLTDTLTAVLLKPS